MTTYLEAEANPTRNTGAIRLYDEAAFAGMRKACQLTARCLDGLAGIVEPGVTTDAIDRYVMEFGLANDAVPATLNYRGYTKSVCTSINEVICHGIPDDRPLRNGDIVNVDVTVYIDGMHGDCSETVYVGHVDPAAERLVKATHEAMMAAIDEVRPGQPFYVIGRAIDEVAKKYGYSVVRDFTGHGIGSLFHMDPQVLHYFTPRMSERMQTGMTFTIEPMK